MISIENLTLSYNKHSTVIDSLNLFMEENNIHGIVGLNGAGKTTLLNALYGLLKTDSGKIHFAGRKLSKKDISYLVTENYFYSNITGREYIGLFRNTHFNLEKWNELFSLPLDELIDHYSTGMKKKLALLSILKQDKPILILDEPFNGLDMETCRIIRSILLRLKERGKTVIITSHILETLTNLCDYIHYLENGRITLTTDKTHFKEFEEKLFQSIENKNIGWITELID